MTRLLILFLVPVLAGCETLAYYTQSARGQLGVMAASRPVKEVMTDPGTPLGLVGQTRLRLEALYEADVQPEELLRLKASILKAAHKRYLEIRQGWAGHTGNDRWIDRPLNNADIASFDTYHALVPASRQILEQVDGDMAMFHAECRAIAAMQPEQREAVMNGLLVMSLSP